jgi:3-isopropylmalate/(R)-2-methylmalate dehydratase small subunit
LSEKVIDDLFSAVEENEGFQLTVDLEQQELTSDQYVKEGNECQFNLHFDLEKFRRHCLLKGLDEIGLTLQHTDDIQAYEEKQKSITPWIYA